MASRFLAASLVASPCYPNSVAWSEENLVAVASGHLVTILNPEVPIGPRGVINIPSAEPFPIGTIEKKDLLTGCLMPTILSRDTHPCVRSISWSHPGLAPNSGCLLAVCTREGRVKLYRQPFCEFRADWVEVMDISDMLCSYLQGINFGEFDIPSSKSSHVVKNCKDAECDNDLERSILSRGQRHRTTNNGKIINETEALGNQLSLYGESKTSNGSCTPKDRKPVTACTELVTFPCSMFKKGSLVQVRKENGSQLVWVNGKIKSMDGAKALVYFPEVIPSGNQEEWVELNIDSDKMDDSSLLDGIVVGQINPLPKIRPFIDVGNLSEQILLAECHGLEDVLHVEQAVEAWINNRWVEGLLVDFKGHSLRVKLIGDSDTIILDATTVRLAPVWNGGLKSWQVIVVKIQPGDMELTEVTQISIENLRKSNIRQTLCTRGRERKSNKEMRQNSTLPLITAGQYASRSAMLSSLVVAWSPVLHASSKIGVHPPHGLSSDFAILAVGGKSGKVSFWRIHEPEIYSVERGRFALDVLLVGLLQVHTSWVTAISWGKFAKDASNSRVLLVTGSSDGRVKIWLGDTDQLFKSSEVNHASFSLLEELPVTSTPVSTLSLTLPVHSPYKMQIAIGRVSGSLEVWIFDIFSCKFEHVGSYDVHGQVITGLAWAFDGRCLYSSSQENSVRSWILMGSSLKEVPFPSNPLGVRSSLDLPSASDSCFGLAISPGNLVAAVVRGFDADLLNPMYQARIQKAVVEFFWIGGQQIELPSDTYPVFGNETSAGFSDTELACWQSNILWSLKQYDQVEKTLVLWDVIAVLLAFKQASPDYMDAVLIKWLSSWLDGCPEGFSTENILLQASRSLSNIPSRQLHLLNIICRRVILSDFRADILNGKQHKLERIDCLENDKSSPWIELLVNSEKELRERIVGFSFAAVLGHRACSDANISTVRHWLPVAVAPMKQWVLMNQDWVQNQLKFLRSEIGELHGRIHPTCDYATEEKCSFCSASVPYESPEVAFCKGAKCTREAGQSLKSVRCAVSMQVFNTTISWFCMCCQRRAKNLAPWTLFTMSSTSIDVKSLTESNVFDVPLKPLCPFCGILLQKLQPSFLLSTSPV
ncbi:uncharacterized protein LOC122646148 isoform X2 [Telopea speciosissima]|uniref:uncharacterized protein LOC122646148 isoform X2 n=1 Tax=Telopea speciosissima TaxID=54955 RepID=UPI001CC3E92E|nr:uncharacterized protein LOC122646148 isoform X2 [Telopea speciosissima]